MVKAHDKGDPLTELQKRYLVARQGGRVGHFAALRTVSNATGLDPDTVGRCLDRAREADAMDARKARRKKGGK